MRRTHTIWSVLTEQYVECLNQINEQVLNFFEQSAEIKLNCMCVCVCE